MRFVKLLLFPAALVIGGWGSALTLAVKWEGRDARIACEQSVWGPDEAACRAEILSRVCGPRARVVDVTTRSRPPQWDEWYDPIFKDQRVYTWTFHITNCRPA